MKSIAKLINSYFQYRFIFTFIACFFFTPAILIGRDNQILSNGDIIILIFLPLSIMTVVFIFGLVGFLNEYRLRIVLGKRFYQFDSYLKKIFKKTALLIIGLFISICLLAIIRFSLNPSLDNLNLLIPVILTIILKNSLKDFVAIGN